MRLLVSAGVIAVVVLNGAGVRTLGVHAAAVRARTITSPVAMTGLRWNL